VQGPSPTSETFARIRAKALSNVGTLRINTMYLDQGYFRLFSIKLFLHFFIEDLRVSSCLRLLALHCDSDICALPMFLLRNLLRNTVSITHPQPKAFWIVYHGQLAFLQYGWSTQDIRSRMEHAQNPVAFVVHNREQVRHFCAVFEVSRHDFGVISRVLTSRIPLKTCLATQISCLIG
jgi:hypothetical protein